MIATPLSGIVDCLILVHRRSVQSMIYWMLLRGNLLRHIGSHSRP
jgi:hypothetical protein